MKHSAELFEALYGEALSLRASAHRSTMFGCPAVYVGRRLAACVHGDAIGLRVPEDVARKAFEPPHISHFQPHGKSAMREWIQLSGGLPILQAHRALLKCALDYAEANNG